MIRTVLGDIKRNQPGNVLMHEHIECVSNDMLRAFGKRWVDEVRLEECAVNVLNELKSKIKLGIFVDGTPVDLGRNVRLLKRISERTGVHIVASAGLYYYPSMISCNRSAEEIAEWFIYECQNGIEGTDILPGILKCAADGGGMTRDIKKRLMALALTQKTTGLPMYAHCSHTDNLAIEMMDLFEMHGANPEKIIIGHASRRLDTDYLEKILKRGYYICIDQSWTTDDVAEVVYKLCNKCYERKLLFSHDHLMYNDFEACDKLGLDYPQSVHVDRYSFLYSHLIPAFEKYGCSDTQCDMFLYKNALEILDF